MRSPNKNGKNGAMDFTLNTGIDFELKPIKALKKRIRMFKQQ